MACFWAVLLIFFAIIEAGAVPYGATGGTSMFGAWQHAEVPRYGVTGGQTMIASYYGYTHAGNMTASGVPFDPEGYTAAHRTLPFGTQLLVSHGGNSVMVTVNDRGPHVDGIDLDLSQGAAEAIGLTPLGVAPVEVAVLQL